MKNYFKQGEQLKLQIKGLIFEFMQSSEECASNSTGLKQAEIFRECGLDWGDYPNATSSNQQYWVVGLLRDLEKDNKVQRDMDTKKWRLK